MYFHFVCKNFYLTQVFFFVVCLTFTPSLLHLHFTFLNNTCIRCPTFINQSQNPSACYILFSSEEGVNLAMLIAAGLEFRFWPRHQIDLPQLCLRVHWQHQASASTACHHSASFNHLVQWSGEVHSTRHNFWLRNGYFSVSAISYLKLKSVHVGSSSTPFCPTFDFRKTSLCQRWKGRSKKHWQNDLRWRAETSGTISPLRLEPTTSTKEV